MTSVCSKVVNHILDTFFSTASLQVERVLPKHLSGAAWNAPHLLLHWRPKASSLVIFLSLWGNVSLQPRPSTQDIFLLTDFFSPFKSGVIKPQPMAEPSYWFYCREPWDILMMYCSINGNWWDRYWWRMVHFAAIRWIPVTLPATYHLWKCCAVARKLLSSLLMLPFPCMRDEGAITVITAILCQARGWAFLTHKISSTPHRRPFWEVSWSFPFYR